MFPHIAWLKDAGPSSTSVIPSRACSMPNSRAARLLLSNRTETRNHVVNNSSRIEDTHLKVFNCCFLDLEAITPTIELPTSYAFRTGAR
jgi:hypothetical protein